MPDWLSKPAKVEWRRIVPILGREGLLTRLDRTTLALYCQAYADYVQSLDYVKTPLVKTKKGNVIQNPALSIKNRAFQLLAKISAEFGLSPSSRSNIQVQKKPQKSRAKAAPFKVA